MRAETVNGALVVVFDDAPERGELKLSSVNGSVKLHLPASAQGTFRAETVNGSIRTDFPLEVTKAKFGPMSSLEGTLGEGQASFDIETVNGSIRILNGESVEARIRYDLEELRKR